MKRIIITTSIGLLIVSLCFAELSALPRFEDYPVNNIYEGKPKLVNLRSHPEARTWRTILKEGAKEGPNFAGHYTIVKWGCGTSCDGFAIVDAATGTVYFPKILSYVISDYSPQEHYGLYFRKNSKLLVAYGSPYNSQDQSGRSGVYYYLWEGNDLKLIKFQLYK